MDAWARRIRDCFFTTPDARNQLQLTQYGWHMIEQCGNYENEPWTIAKSARRFECGSSNMLGIHALSASLSLLLETSIKQVENGALECFNYLLDAIRSHPNLQQINTSDATLASPILVFQHKTIDNKSIYQQLQKEWSHLRNTRWWNSFFSSFFTILGNSLIVHLKLLAAWLIKAQGFKISGFCLAFWPHRSINQHETIRSQPNPTEKSIRNVAQKPCKFILNTRTSLDYMKCDLDFLR